MVVSHQCDVAVVGLGPVGSLIANLLGQCGLTVVALDREPDVMQVPRGVGIDGEIMRAMQSLGLAEKLEPYLKVFRGAQYIDSQGKVVATRPPAKAHGSQGWPDRYNVHQPEFEEVLRQAMRSNEQIIELTSTEVTDLVQDEDFVTVKARSLVDSSQTSVRAKYVIGADGGRSLTRKIIDATYEDYGMNQPWIVADFQVTDEANVPDINTHYADPVSPAIYIHVVRDIRRFEFRAAPEEDLSQSVIPSAIWDRVSRWLQPHEAQLLRAAVYTHRSLLVDRWRHGRILLAGDAAHQTPPFLGQGLCTGVRDAVSVAWRLRDVILRGASPTLLDSYGTERSAHARHFIKTATELGTKLSAPTKSSIDSLNQRIGREGRGTPPRLGPGIHDESCGGGYLSGQPSNDEGVKIDELSGYEYSLIISESISTEAREIAARMLSEVHGQIILADFSLESWLKSQHASAILIRPDRYVHGSYPDSQGLLRGLEHLTREKDKMEVVPQ